jgi:hypothetical protein
MYTTIVGEWSIETTHPIDLEAPDYCSDCAGAVGYTISFAEAYGSHQHSIPDEVNGGYHVISARPVEA